MWKNIDNWYSLAVAVNSEAQKIRQGSLNFGKLEYSLSLLHGVHQAILCNYDSIVAIELGVAQGNGLLSLSRAAEHFSQKSGIPIEVYGFDNATGLPQMTGPEDHPEIWSEGLFNMGDPAILKSKLPEFTHLIIGDVNETVSQFKEILNTKKIAFLSIDLDYYSSTKNALGILKFNPENYIPAVPLYVDDVYDLITYNPWCGEEKAINEFNQENNYRKIHRKENFNINRFHVCQILDHPVRLGKIKPKFPFEIGNTLI